MSEKTLIELMIEAKRLIPDTDKTVPCTVCHYLFCRCVDWRDIVRIDTVPRVDLEFGNGTLPAPERLKDV